MEQIQYVGTTEAAAILAARFGAYSPDTVKNLAQRGKIPGAQKIARNWLIPREWAENYEKTRS